MDRIMRESYVTLYVNRKAILGRNSCSCGKKNWLGIGWLRGLPVHGLISPRSVLSFLASHFFLPGISITAFSLLPFLATAFLGNLPQALTAHLLSDLEPEQFSTYPTTVGKKLCFYKAPQLKVFPCVSIVILFVILRF